MSAFRNAQLAFLTLVCTATANAQSPLPTDYRLDVVFAPREHTMKGCADVTFNTASLNTKAMTFYLHGELSVDSVFVGTTRLSHKSRKIFYHFDYSLVANSVQVDLPNGMPSSMRIYYSGYFSPSKARSPSDYMRIEEEGVFLRGYGYSLWFPVFVNSGEPPYSVAFSSVRIQTPKDYQSVFVGTRIRDSESGGERISEWSAPSLSVIDVQLAARRYLIIGKGNYFIYSLKSERSPSRASAILDFTRRLDSLYALRYRSASGGRMIHVLQMPQYGDIASDNVVGISDAAWQDFNPGSYSGRTLAHELVHSYVQIPTPVSSPLYAMIIEGFPSYFHYPALAEILGEEFYQQAMASMEKSYLQRKLTEKNSRGEQLPPEKPIVEIRAEEIGLYKDIFILNDRVGLFFDNVRRQLGREKSWSFVKDLVNTSTLDFDSFERVYVKYFPNGKEDLRVWLKTNEYPERFRREK